MGGLEERRQTSKLLDGFDKVGSLCGLGLGLGFGEGLGVGGEKSEAEGESRRWEHGESLDEDVGHGLWLEEVGVELVAAPDG